MKTNSRSLQQKGSLLLCLLCMFLCLLCACAPSAPAPEEAPTESPIPSAPAPTEPPFTPDCAPEDYTSLGSKPEYLLNGAFITEQGKFLYYVEGKSIKKTDGTDSSLLCNLDSAPSCLNICGDKLYFLQEGMLCRVRTDGRELQTGLLQNLEKFVIFQDTFYCADTAGNAFSIPVDGEQRTILRTGVSNLFVFNDELFFCTANDIYGYDLYWAGSPGNPLLQNAALFGVNGARIYAETPDGMILLTLENDPVSLPLTFSRLPVALCSDGKTLFYVTREGRLCAQPLSENSGAYTVVEENVQYAVIIGEAIVYQTQDGAVRTCTKNGWQRSNIADGLAKKTAAETDKPLSCKILLLKNENERLEAGKSYELSLYLDGNPLAVSGLKPEAALAGLFFESRDEEIAVLNGTHISCLTEGSVVVRASVVGNPVVFSECLLKIETKSEY